MPHGYMDLLELSRFLGVDLRRVDRMAQRGEIPCQKVAGQLRFNRAEIAEWLQRQMPVLNREKLANMDAGITSNRQLDPEDAIIAPLLHPQAIEPSLVAQTKNSVLRELVAIAQKTELLYDPESLLEALIRREELCSTAMEGGIAFPHPRRPLPYAVAEPILVIAVTRGIGFGAPDGRLTDLFFMTCSQDDRHHLHILARLCRMLYDKNLSNHLRQAGTTEEIIELMRNRELEIIADSV